MLLCLLKVQYCLRLVSACISTLLLFSEKPITIVPTLDKKELDLYKLFTLVVQRGGLFQVVKGKLWREITKELELSPGIRNDAYNLRTQ